MISEDEFNYNVEMAKMRIRKLYNKFGNNIYLSYSGGKDSTIVLALIKLVIADGLPVKCPAVFCDTKIELNATKEFVDYIKNEYYRDVVIIKPDKSFDYVIKNYGKPIRSKLKSRILSDMQKNHNSKSAHFLYDDNHNRFSLANKDLHFIHPDFDIKISNKCCTQLKKIPVKKYSKQNEMCGYFTGERAAEGGVRAVNYDKRIMQGKSPCTVMDGKQEKVSPIIDWSDDMCDLFIQKYKVPLSKAYTVYGCTRTGCFLCPFALDIANNLYTLYKYEPNNYKASMHWLKDVYIAQNVKLPFDEDYEIERQNKWENTYTKMRYEMLLKYRPKSKLISEYHKNKSKLF